MDLFKIDQLCILHIQIFINFLCLLELFFKIIFIYYLIYSETRHLRPPS